MIAHSTGTGNGGSAFTIATEHILAAVAVPGEFSIHLDRNLMAAADVLETYVRQIILTSGTKREIWRWQWAGAAPTWKIDADSPWFPNELGDSGALEFCVNQKFGTGRALPWKVLWRGAAAGYPKGIAVARFAFAMYTTANALATGLTFSTKAISKDGGTEATIAGTITEIGSTGMYYVPLSASEMSADEIMLRFVATGAVTQTIKFPTAR
jgi:hypothetical protein